MGYAVFAIKKQSVEACRDRAIAFVSSRTHILVQDGGLKKRVEVLSGNRDQLIEKVFLRFVGSLKAKKVAEFDAPQFCKDWIELAKKTDAPFEQFEIKFGVAGVSYESIKV